MISNTKLSNLAMNFEIDRCCSLGKDQKFDQISVADRASVVQALIGAVFVDSGCDLRVVGEVMGRLGVVCPTEAAGGGGEEADGVEEVGEVDEEVIVVGRGSGSVL